MATRKSTTKKSTTKKTVILHVWDYYDRQQRYAPVNLRITKDAKKWRQEVELREALVYAVNELFYPECKEYNSITKAQVRKLHRELPNGIGIVELEEL